jgi:hypothetical protein
MQNSSPITSRLPINQLTPEGAAIKMLEVEVGKLHTVLSALVASNPALSQLLDPK